MHKKNLTKISEFLCSHFNIEDGRKCATFLTFYALLFQDATEMQKKIFVVYGEGAVSDQMCQKWFVKFHTGDSLLVDQLKLIGIKLRHKLRTINIIQHRRYPTYLKYPNQ